jgi:hypothetical protein
MTITSIKVRMYQIAFFVLACLACACSGSINGGVKTANDRNSESADELPGDVQAVADMERAREAQAAQAESDEAPEKSEASKPQAEPKAPPANPFAPDGSDPFGVGMGGTQMLPPGLIFSTLYVGTGAMPREVSALCGGRCIGVMNYTPRFLAIRIGDSIVTDAAVASGMPAILPANVKMLQGAQTVRAGIGIIPPGNAMETAGLNSGKIHIPCVSSGTCPNIVSVVVMEYEGAFTGEVVSTGNYCIGTVRLPSGNWGQRIDITQMKLRRSGGRC